MVENVFDFLLEILDRTNNFLVRVVSNLNLLQTTKEILICSPSKFFVQIHNYVPCYLCAVFTLLNYFGSFCFRKKTVLAYATSIPRVAIKDLLTARVPSARAVCLG